MRRWLLVLMIVLLPLRGWAGGVMTVQVAAAPTGAGPALAAMPADCPMLAAAAAAGALALPGDDAAAAADAAGSHGCTSCALCLPIAEAPAPVVGAAVGAVYRQSMAAPPSFESAELARAVEPPIS